MKNMKKIVMTVATVIMTVCGMVFTSCSAEDGWAPEVEKVVNNYVPYEVQVWKPTPHTTLLSDTLNTVEGSQKEWSLTYSFDVKEAVIILPAAEQGKPEIVSSDDNGNATLSDGQEVVGNVVVNNAGVLSVIENARLVVTNISAENKTIGEANATLVTVYGKLSAEIRLTDGTVERFETTVKRTYIQAEVPVKVEIETVVEKVTDSVYVEVEKIVYVPVEVEVHDTTTVVVHDTITVTNTVVVRDTVIVTETVNNYIEIHDTTYVDKYVYLNSLNKSVKDKFGYSEALLKMGDAEVLKLLVTLDKRVIEVPEAQLYNANKVSADNRKATFDDEQISNLTIVNNNGAYVESVSWSVNFEDSPIHDGVAYGEVLCTVVGYTYNERGEQVNFTVEMTPGYLHFVKTPEPTIVEPEVVSYSVAVNFTLGEDKLTGEYTITGSDGYSAVLTQAVAQWGLCQNVATKWVKDSKSTRTDDMTESSKAKDLTRDGKVWSYNKVSRMTLNKLSWTTTSGGIVDASQNILLATTTFTHVLPNGESVVITLDGKTLYSNEEKNEGKKIDYCDEEQAPAEYAYTQYQGVKHYISGTISINGQNSEINFSNFGLEKDGNGFVLGGNTISFDVVKVLK